MTDSALSVDVFVGRACFWSAFGRGGGGNGSEGEEAALLMLRAGLAEADRQSRGAAAPGSGSGPSSPASLFNYLRSKTARECVQAVSPRPPGAPTSCGAALSAGQRPAAPALGSFLSGRIVWKRAWSGIGGSCQCCVPALSGRHLTDRLAFFFFFFLKWF